MAVRVIGRTDLHFDDPKLRLLMEHINRLTSEMQLIQQMLNEGSAGQVLVKRSNADFDAVWSDAPGVGGGSIDAQNLGEGARIFAGKSGPVLQFRTLAGGSGVTITVRDDEVLISTTGSAADLEPFIYAGAF